MLFTLRFIFCNLANSRWQDHLVVGKNLTGAAYSIAIFFSLWSLIMLGSDASYCKYPTDSKSSTNVGTLSYCTIYHDSFPDGSMNVSAFIADCAAQEATGWNQSDMGFYQLYEPTLDTPQSGLEFEDAVAADLLPSFAVIFQQQNNVNIRTAVSLHKDEGARAWVPPAPDRAIHTCTLPECNKKCPVREGSMMEAVATYAAACEINDRMRDATLMSYSQFLLNLLELLVLVQIGVSTGRIKHLPAAVKQSNHADTAASSTLFFFPIRLMGAVSVSALLIFFSMATIDLIALRFKEMVVDIEMAYNDDLVPILNDPGGLPHDWNLPRYHNLYFDDGGGTIPPYQARPPFNGLDGDCPCSTIGAMKDATELARDLYPPVKDFVTYCMGGTQRRQLEPSNQHWRRLQQGGGCPAHAHAAQDGSCYCDTGYAVVHGQCRKSAITSAEKCSKATKTLQRMISDRQTGIVIKCSFEHLRMFWEPIPFCIRCE